MKETNTAKLYRSITNIEDRYIEESLVIPLKKKHSWGISCKTILIPKLMFKKKAISATTTTPEREKVLAQKPSHSDKKESSRRTRTTFKALATIGLAACLCLAVGINIWVMNRQDNRANGGNSGNSNGFWGDGDRVLSEAHRADFSPEFSPEADAAFADMAGVIKFYKLLDNEWFLDENLTDFSQALMTDVFYIVPGSSKGISEPKEYSSYSVYTLDDDGKLHWGMEVSAPANHIVPYEFCGLTTDIIEEDLEGVDYEDYVITQSNRLYTVFVWARCANGQDVFVTYPARPEFVGLENRGRYTLEEIQDILSQVYSGDYNR